MTPTHHFHVYHVGNIHALHVSETLLVCCVPLKKKKKEKKREHVFYCWCFPLILILPSIFQSLLRKEAHYKTLRTLPSPSSSFLSSSEYPHGDSFTRTQTDSPLFAYLFSFCPQVNIHHNLIIALLLLKLQQPRRLKCEHYYSVSAFSHRSHWMWRTN